MLLCLSRKAQLKPLQRHCVFFFNSFLSGVSTLLEVKDENVFQGTHSKQSRVRYGLPLNISAGTTIICYPNNDTLNITGWYVPTSGV